MFTATVCYNIYIDKCALMYLVLGLKFIIYSDECVISNYAATSAIYIKTITENIPRLNN